VSLRLAGIRQRLGQISQHKWRHRRRRHTPHRVRTPRDFHTLPHTQKKKNPNNPAPTYPSKSTTQNFTAAPSLLLLLLLLLLLHNQSSKTHIPKTKKNTKPDTELMLQTVIPKTNKQTTRAKAQQQEIHNKKIQTANAVVTD